jgi:hypothetical protein
LRRLTVIALLLACSLLVAAVAQGGKPRREQKRLRPADMALAKRTTLRASDLSPAWTRRKPDKPSNELPSCPGVDMDFSAFTITATARSWFALRGAPVFVESEVEVFESRSDAFRDFRKGTSAPALHCLGRWLRSEAAKEQPGIRIVSSRLLSRPRLAEQSVLYRIVMETRTDRGRIRLFADLVGFQQGRTAVTLSFFSPIAPLPAPLVLARKVAARTR